MTVDPEHLVITERLAETVLSLLIHPQLDRARCAEIGAALMAAVTETAD